MIYSWGVRVDHKQTSQPLKAESRYKPAYSPIRWRQPFPAPSETKVNAVNAVLKLTWPSLRFSHASWNRASEGERVTTLWGRNRSSQEAGPRKWNRFVFILFKASRILYQWQGKAVLGLLRVCSEFGRVHLVDPMVNIEWFSGTITIIILETLNTVPRRRNVISITPKIVKWPESFSFLIHVKYYSSLEKSGRCLGVQWSIYTII